MPCTKSASYSFGKELSATFKAKVIIRLIQEFHIYSLFNRTIPIREGGKDGREGGLKEGRKEGREREITPDI